VFSVVFPLLSITNKRNYEKKENSFETFIDILSQVTMGNFEIENANDFIICDVKNEHKELLKYFNIGEKEFLNYNKISSL